jgi:hypothetical protein
MHAHASTNLALEVERVARNLGDGPVAALDHLVRGDEVADEEEDAHHDVLRDGDDVGAGDLEDLDPALDGRVEVDVVRADAGGDAELEVLRRVDELAREVARVEGRRNEDLRLRAAVSRGRARREARRTSLRWCWNALSAPSFSEVTMSSWPWLSRNWRSPSSFSTVPSRRGSSFAA